MNQTKIAEVIAISNGKGGCGKTTTAVNVSCCLAMRSKKVLIIDADPVQGTATDFISLNNLDFPAEDGTSVTKLIDGIRIDQANLQRTLQTHKRNYDYIIIDTAPRVDSKLGKLISLADKVIIPVIASDSDVWASEPIVTGIQLSQKLTGKPKAAYALCSDIAGSNLYDETVSTINELIEARGLLPMPVLQNSTITRASYRRSTGSGTPVIHLNDPKAASEMELITNEILGL